MHAPSRNLHNPKFSVKLRMQMRFWVSGTVDEDSNENLDLFLAHWNLNKHLKGIENWAIILVPLIMILSRGHTGQIKG